MSEGCDPLADVCDPGDVDLRVQLDSSSRNRGMERVDCVCFGRRDAGGYHRHCHRVRDPGPSKGSQRHGG